MKRLIFILYTIFMLNFGLLHSSAHSVDHFVDLNNGTVLDTKSNLFRLKNANCL